MNRMLIGAAVAAGLAGATMSANAQTLNLMRGVDAPHFDAQRLRLYGGKFHAIPAI